ncbi:Glutaredoxin family protein [Raphanus sativus]|nr:Glutaredoxin family protein [Raphanus sativus]
MGSSPSKTASTSPPTRRGDTHHLTSTTYGSLLLVDLDGSKTVSRDSLSPDSVINTWELMDGLDDESYELQPLRKHLSEESLSSGLADPSLVSSHKKAVSSSAQARAEDKIVLYFTTLRGIRKTHEDCCCVRMILRGKELQSIILGGDAEKPVCLPQVFIGGSHVGGVEEIMKLNDSGELAEMLKGFPACESLGACRCCGDARFVPCSNCDGSTKVFEGKHGMFKRCSKCNENGLVRCLECSL